MGEPSSILISNKKGTPVNQSNQPPYPAPPHLTSETRVHRRNGVVLRHVAGEHMLVPTVTREVDLESMFLLNATGAFIWEQLDGQRRAGELGEAVAQAFATDSGKAAADVLNFLSHLLERNLAEMA
jgi:hypothetical protein